MMPGPGIEPGTHWWEASALNTAPTLLPSAPLALDYKYRPRVNIKDIYLFLKLYYSCLCVGSSHPRSISCAQSPPSILHASHVRL